MSDVTARPRKALRRVPVGNVIHDQGFRRRLELLRYRVSFQQFLAELLGKRWMEPAIPLVLLIVVVVYFSTTIPGFLAAANAQSTLQEFTEFGFVALAMGIVLIAGGFDLSVGAIFGLCNMMALIFIGLIGLPVWMAILATMAVGGLVGLVNGIVVAYLKARPFLTTLVTLIVVRAVLGLLDLHYSQHLATTVIDDPIWTWLRDGTVLGLPAGAFLLLITLVVGHILLSRGRAGQHFTAVGASRKAARHAGISVERVLLSSYVLSGLLCGFAGVLLAARLGSASSRAGENLELSALTAVILGGISLAGGRGTVWRALIGAGIVSFLGKGLLLKNVSGDLYTAILAGILLTVVAADIKWAKNRSKAIQKIYVNPTLVEYGPLPDTDPDSGTVFAMNDRLANAEGIAVNRVEGPEDVILDSRGRLYCGTRQGWIYRFSGDDFAEQEVFARIGGHPLGMAFDADENLIVCVAGMGLYGVAPDGTVSKLADETNRTWTRLRDDSRLRLADDCDVTPDGKIYFSEATTRFEMADWILDGLEGRPNGRVICYDPETKKTHTVVRDLVFPNGICSCHDGESILIAQTWLCRITRYWHSGARKGQLEIFADNLPGWVDNINRASDGCYWVALCGMRSPAYDLAMRMPGFRRRMIKQIHRDEWLYPSMNHGALLKISGEGAPLETAWDPGGKRHASITSMREHDGYLYIGGLENNRVGRIRLTSETGSTSNRDLERA